MSVQKVGGRKRAGILAACCLFQRLCALPVGFHPVSSLNFNLWPTRYSRPSFVLADVPGCCCWWYLHLFFFPPFAPTLLPPQFTLLTPSVARTGGKGSSLTQIGRNCSFVATRPPRLDALTDRSAGRQNNTRSSSSPFCFQFRLTFYRRPARFMCC